MTPSEGMKHLAILILAALLMGCAGNSVDTDFRRKVQESDTSLSGSYDGKKDVGGVMVGEKLIFRDPDAKP